MQALRMSEKAVQREEQERRVHFAATHPIKATLKNLNSGLNGLDAVSYTHLWLLTPICLIFPAALSSRA